MPQARFIPSPRALYTWRIETPADRTDLARLNVPAAGRMQKGSHHGTTDRCNDVTRIFQRTDYTSHHMRRAGVRVRCAAVWAGHVRVESTSHTSPSLSSRAGSRHNEGRRAEQSRSRAAAGRRQGVDTCVWSGASPRQGAALSKKRFYFEKCFRMCYFMALSSVSTQIKVISENNSKIRFAAYTTILFK